MINRNAFELTALQNQSLRFWLKGLAADQPSSSNQPSLALPFQRWFKFKEAFAPNLVIDCLRSLDYRPETCLDAFGGCGTSGLTCQFLGIVPTLVELNPFIADLAEAKLREYDHAALTKVFTHVRKCAMASHIDQPMCFLGEAPRTFCESSDNDRWLYTQETLSRIVAYRESIEEVQDAAAKRLLRVLLGSCLVPLSNVVVNGKGRKYRQAWATRQSSPADVDRIFETAFHAALSDIRVYSDRATAQYQMHRGSALTIINDVTPADVAIFSPPYPNSFDYTDVYNIELWVLGYLKTRVQDRALRLATLRSHVQVDLATRGVPSDSKSLRNIIRKMQRVRNTLWDPRLPEMVDGYFADLSTLLGGLRRKLREGGETFIVVGNSCYNGIIVNVAEILAETAMSHGYKVVSSTVLRRMRKSAQQGGDFRLEECVLRLRLPKRSPKPRSRASS